jgi:hypothetical protein
VITIEPQQPDKPAFDIAAVVDPASQGAQKISTLLLVLKDVLNAKIRVFLNCVDKVINTGACQRIFDIGALSLVSKICHKLVFNTLSLINELV